MSTDLAVRCTLSVGQLALGRRTQRVPYRQAQHHASTRSKSRESGTGPGDVSNIVPCARSIWRV